VRGADIHPLSRLDQQSKGFHIQGDSVKVCQKILVIDNGARAGLRQKIGILIENRGIGSGTLKWPADPYKSTTFSMIMTGHFSIPLPISVGCWIGVVLAAA